MTPDQYGHKLREIGELASRLQSDPENVLGVLFDFYRITDIKDREAVIAACDTAPTLVQRPLLPILSDILPLPQLVIGGPSE